MRSWDEEGMKGVARPEYGCWELRRVIVCMYSVVLSPHTVTQLLYSPKSAHAAIEVKMKKVI